ncbi:hypothetical protein EGW08_000229 [Elysia chlorotica]|uniref:Amino acid permease/ SLC12A domain-containing protein n=1 Tax=Elysia chlorotica TaxID=188477 RepID=A0A433UDX8_ELYCH|nr:hypothetical protein EGW08_000229 [Elysia chlorotica]
MACFNSLWSFGGWTNVNQVTSGIRKPPRNVPRVIKFILPLVLVLYILTVLSFFTTMTPAELVKSQAIGVTWAERVLGPASSLITVSVGLICLGSVNATFLSAGRLSGVAARNNQMPDVVSWVHVSSKSPLISVCFRCVVAIVLVCVATGQELLRFGMFTVWLFHGSSALALLILRFKNKDKKRPYKVDLWIPVVVVVVTCFLLLSPFLQVPERTFIVALVLIALSLLSYHPINWLKSKEAINVPDKLIIWLQLFFRVAPKRDLRREKRSMMRRMSMFARDSILITPNVIQSPEQMRRFSRRMSRMSRRGRGGPVSGSPALIRRLAELEKESVPDGLRRRNRRGSSMAEADGGAGMKRWRSNSMWAFQTDSKPSPAIIRKKPNRGSHSFSPADIKNLVSPPSLPILKNRFNTTPEATVGSAPGELAPPNGALQQPHSVLRPVPSPIPEEDLNALATTPSEDVNRLEALRYPPHAPPQAHTQVPDSGDEEDDEGDEGDEVEENLEEEAQSENALQVVADFESDGGGEYEVLAPASEARRISLGQEELSDDGESDFVSTCSSEDDSVSSIKSHESFNMFKSLFAADSSSPGTSSTDDSDDDMVDEDLPTLPMHYYNKDESASECSGSGSDNWTNEGYVDNEDGVPTKVPRRKPVEGEDGGAEGAGWDNGEANGKEGVESKPEPVAGWHVNSAFYLNMEDEGDGRDAKFATGTPASEDALTEDGGIQMKPVHFHPGSSGGDSKV